MIGHGSKFGRKKEQAIAALLSHRNVEESAKSNRNLARDAQAVDATTGIKGCLSGSPTVGGVPDQRPPAAERWRRRLSAVQADGGPRYAAVHPGTYCAVHPGVRQLVSGTGKHGNAHSDRRCRNSGRRGATILPTGKDDPAFGSSEAYQRLLCLPRGGCTLPGVLPAAPEW